MKKLSILTGAASFLMASFSTAVEDTPANFLKARDVYMVIGDSSKPGSVDSYSVGDPKQGNYARYEFTNLLDGETYIFKALIRIDGQEYKTQLDAKLHGDNILEITSLLFDNKVEKLDNPKEIYSVINYIGVNHVRGVFLGKRIPTPHTEGKGTFSKTGRFMTRHF